MNPFDEPLILDHSMRQSYENCPRKFFFRYICGLRLWYPINKAGLDFGKSFHLCTEVFDKTQDIGDAFAMFVDNYECSPYEKKRTPERAQELLNLYAEYIQRFDVSFEPHEIEVSFQIPLTDKVIHAGRMDRLYKGVPWEIKTTLRLYEKGSADKYLQNWKGHNSIRGYAYPFKATSIKVLAFGVEKTPKTTYSTTGDGMEVLDFQIENWEFKNWRTSTLDVAMEIRQKLKSYGQIPPALNNQEEVLKQALEEGLWIYWRDNSGNCFSWNSQCPYLDICKRNVPRGMVEQDYYVDNWKPYMGFNADVKEGPTPEAEGGEI